jgi:hypothetical protein
MTYDAVRKAVLLYVGAGACICSPINQTWSWDGTTWTQLNTIGNPDQAPLSNEVNNGTIAWYAANGLTYFVDPTGTWSLGSGVWQKVSGSGPALTNGPLIYGTNSFAITDDEAPGVLLELGPYGDTWAGNGKAWTALNPPTAPSARFAAAIAYDPVRAQVVLFGGSTSGPNWSPLSDTWVWDGKVWTQAT